MLRAFDLPGPTAGVLLYSLYGSDWNGVPLPLSLQSLGLTGCSLTVRPDALVPFVVGGVGGGGGGGGGGGSSTAWTVRLPSQLGASSGGLDLYAQAFFLDPGANAAGIGATAGLQMPVGGNATPTSLVTSIQQWGITYTFAQPVRAGQFVNGDWFVLGSATIVDMQPACVVVNGRTLHGAMVDPDPSTPIQGYDSDLYAGFANFYDPARNRALGVTPATPLVLPAGHSLIKTISNTDATLLPRLRTAAVLTSVASVPRIGSFRPPYAGTDHAVRHNVAEIDWSRLLSLAPTPGAPSAAAEAARLQRVWLDHAPSWLGRMMHPIDAMPDYGRDLAAALGQAMLLCNTNLPMIERAPLVVRVMQIGLDNFGALQAGGRWPGLGGHGSGRKLPILFTGALLHDQAMLAIGQNYVSQRSANGNATAFFGEDCQTFYVAETSPGVVNFGQGGYTLANVGLAEWGFAHVEFPQDDHEPWGASPYRVCCTTNAWIGHVLVARMMGLVGAWNHQSLFDYTDRYLAITTTAWERSWSPWVDAMWVRYRPQF